MKEVQEDAVPTREFHRRPSLEEPVWDSDPNPVPREGRGDQVDLIMQL